MRVIAMSSLMCKTNHVQQGTGVINDNPREVLKVLVEELETILIEIANLEEQEDLPDIELIRDGVDRKGILLKINIHQMGDGLERKKLESREKDRALI